MTDRAPGALGGLLTKRQRWGLSWKGWVALLVCSVILFSLAFRAVHPFLAVTDRVEADVLIVEGWIPDSALKAALTEYSTGNYSLLLVAIPWSPRSRTNSFVRPPTAPARFFKTHLPGAVIHDIYPTSTRQDRTYNVALAVRDWFGKSSISPVAVNVLTEDAHARRTRLLYQKAFGTQTEIGVIAAPPEGYDPQRWWKSSEGCKELLGETIGYIYARLFFWP